MNNPFNSLSFSYKIGILWHFISSEDCITWQISSLNPGVSCSGTWGDCMLADSRWAHSVMWWRRALGKPIGINCCCLLPNEVAATGKVLLWWSRKSTRCTLLSGRSVHTVHVCAEIRGSHDCYSAATYASYRANFPNFVFKKCIHLIKYWIKSVSASSATSTNGKTV